MKINKSKILEIRNLNVKYGSNQKSTIKNFKLDLFKGDHLAIIGPSGCGKTTFAKTIVNMLPEGSITQGFIKMSGEDLTKIRFNIHKLIQQISWDEGYYRKDIGWRYIDE